MAFWLAVLILLVWIVARAAGGQSWRIDEPPEQILKRRYARGEIEREDYERRLSDLRK
jgi:putative membrane protein